MPLLAIFALDSSADFILALALNFASKLQTLISAHHF
jgi:hypothetical protein